MAEQIEKELYQTGGDPTFSTPGIVDPTGRTKARGVASGVDLVKTSMGRPWIKVPNIHGDRWIEADVYAVPGAPGFVHLICPQCGNSLRISADRKEWRFDPNRPLHADLRRELEGIARHQLDARVAEGFKRFDGTLNVEPFECTWELDDSLRREFGFARCGWRVSINNNVAVRR